MAITLVTLTGTFNQQDGVTPAEGELIFLLNQALQDTNVGEEQIIGRTSITVPLVDGAFSVMLAATDDPGVIPGGATYHVIEVLAEGESQRVTEYDIILPHEPSTVDLALLPRQTTATPLYQYVEVHEFLARMGDGVAGRSGSVLVGPVEGTTIDVGGGDIDVTVFDVSNRAIQNFLIFVSMATEDAIVLDLGQPVGNEADFRVFIIGVEDSTTIYVRQGDDFIVPFTGGLGWSAISPDGSVIVVEFKSLPGGLFGEEVPALYQGVPISFATPRQGGAGSMPMVTLTGDDDSCDYLVDVCNNHRAGRVLIEQSLSNPAAAIKPVIKTTSWTLLIPFRLALANVDASLTHLVFEDGDSTPDEMTGALHRTIIPRAAFEDYIDDGNNLDLMFWPPTAPTNDIIITPVRLDIPLLP